MLYEGEVRYANAIIKYYPNHINISCFNRIVVDDIFLRKVRESYFQSDNSVTRSDSVSRAKQKVYDIAMLNDFEYFVTFTFNDKIVSGYDYEEAITRVKNWCKNQVQRFGLVYLLIPELHPTSGRIHLHGFLRWGTESSLVNSGYRDDAGRVIYNLPAWTAGFSTCICLDEHKEYISAYVMKYVTKEVEKISGNFYYAGGKGLQREPIKGYMRMNYSDFEGEEHEVLRDGKYIGLKVKYLVLPISEAIYPGFERISEEEWLKK